MLTNAKKAALVVAGTAAEKFMDKIGDQQEVMAGIADIIIELFAFESALLRTEKIIGKQGEAAAKLPIAYTQSYASKALATIEVAARRVIAYCAEGDEGRMRTVILRRLLKHDPLNTIAVETFIAERNIEAGRYVAM
jgi:butyryl-CoA dehydrogenase